MPEQPREKIVCPDCGAPLPVEAATRAITCPQCGGASAPKPAAAPAIVERVIERVVVERSGKAPAGPHAEPTCPRCLTPLFAHVAHGVRLLGCGLCGGIFLDNDGSQAIVRAPDVEIGTLARRAELNAQLPGVDLRPADLPCAICARPMRRVSVQRVAQLDLCAEHGTWFDGGELHRVMAAYAQPIAGARDESEIAMAELRDRQRQEITKLETVSEAGAIASVGVGLLGVLGALLDAAGDA